MTRTWSCLFLPLTFASLALACSTHKPSAAPDTGPVCQPDGGAEASRSACTFHAGALPADTLDSCAKIGAAMPIQHIVVLMMENRSFDHYLGHLPGNGQDDVDVAPADASNPSAIPGDPAIPWHHADALCFFDTNHEWDPSHAQYDLGLNDGFARTNGASAGYAYDPSDPSGSRAMSYYTAADIPFYYDLASKFAISDRYFAGLLGPTFPNRLYLYAATSAGMIKNELKPGLPTIFQRLADAQVSFKLYASDVAAAFITYMPAASDMVSVEQFATDAAAGTLPQVSFVDPQFLSEIYSTTSEHPPADIQIGEQFVHDQVTALLKSPNWPDSALFITYDEHGGIFDHVPPPPACVPDDIPPEPPDGGDLDAASEAGAAEAGVDEAGTTDAGGAPAYTFDRYGFRVPVFVISPYARPHFVSHTVHSHTSIIRFIEARFGLPALSARDANSDAMLDLFDFDAPPAFAVPPTLVDAPLDSSGESDCAAKFSGMPAPT